MTQLERKSLKVLVVDDDKFMLDLILAALNGLGIDNVGTAANGEEALSYTGREPVDVIFCDLNMPEMDGIEFLRHLADQKFEGGIALISGENPRVLESAEKLAKAHDLNILGALQKPLDRESLLEVLGKLERKKGRRRQGPSRKISIDELRRGLEGNELTVFFQPKVDLQTRRLKGVEALVRWQHPEWGLVGPGAFIPVAEEHDLIDQLTYVVLVKAIEQAGIWSSQGLDLVVSINISVDNLNWLELPEFVVEQVEKAGLKASSVILEVTESRLMQDMSSALEILTRLCMKGVGLSIDDFGTGYSSLEQLQKVPFAELKIDRAFVHGAAKDTTARAIFESSVDLAKKLNMTIVAEGVEDQEDWDFVAALGVDLVQGYFVAKPMPVDEFADWATEWSEAL